MLRAHSNVIDDKKQFMAMAKDLFPKEAKNLNLLLIAYNMGIAGDIKSVRLINNTFAFRYVKQLMEDYGISRVNADWIVSVWCVAYGKRVLGKPCEISLQDKKSGPAIKDDKSETSAKSYGELFVYAKSHRAEGLSVTGFQGDRKQTIIFQNRSKDRDVVEIADNSFSNTPIEEAVITDGIRYIGSKAFCGCTGLHQVVLPVSLEEIDNSAFEDCSALKSITLPVQLKSIGAAAFKNSGLKKLNIPRSVFWIGDEMLSGCGRLESIRLPENIEKIPDRMFENCVELKKAVLHEKLDAIGERAFFGCSSLDFIIIPDSVCSIGRDAFTGTDKQFIIQCSFGSFAEKYCRQNRIKYQLV